MSPPSNRRALHAAMCSWLLAAETEYRHSLAAVQKEATAAARARFASARRELVLATWVTQQFVLWPTAPVPSC